jgi:hypothetical protein
VKTTSLLVAALAVGSLSAQSASSKLDARVMLFAEMTRPPSIVIDKYNNKDQADSQWGGGIRFLGEIASAPGWYYELGGKFESSSNLTFNRNSTVGYKLDLTGLRVTQSYWSVGFAYLATSGGFTYGAHLEARGEALGLTGQVFKQDSSLTPPETEPSLFCSVNTSTTYLRPWGRVSVDYNWKMGSMNPFIGVDGSLALMKTDQTTTPAFRNMDTRTVRALAPRGAFSVYGGFRF